MFGVPSTLDLTPFHGTSLDQIGLGELIVYQPTNPLASGKAGRRRDAVHVRLEEENGEHPQQAPHVFLGLALEAVHSEGEGKRVSVSAPVMMPFRRKFTRQAAVSNRLRRSIRRD